MLCVNIDELFVYMTPQELNLELSNCDTKLFVIF